MDYVGLSVTIEVRYFTDPACPWSWGNEPAIRRLMVQFGDHLSWTYVMGGLARDFATRHQHPGSRNEGSQAVYSALVSGWLNVAEEKASPLDPRLWLESPLASSYPACMAVKAAEQQPADAGERYLRVLREGLMCFRRKLDGTEALVEAARAARLDAGRFRIDLESNATIEAFGEDLAAARAVPPQARADGHVETVAGRERVSLPAVCFAGREWVFGSPRYEAYRDAAEAAGATAAGDPPPDVAGALQRFGRMTSAEVEAVCGLPGPRAHAELWRLAAEWQVKPTRVLTGYLWEPA